MIISGDSCALDGDLMDSWAIWAVDGVLMDSRCEGRLHRDFIASGNPDWFGGYFTLSCYGYTSSADFSKLVVDLLFPYCDW